MNVKEIFFKRVLSIFVDSLVGMTIFFAVRIPPEYFDYSFLPPFILLSVYFTIGNSYVTSGRTLGKRLFGLKAIDSDGELLSIKKSFLRFCLSYGILPILAELPPILFRAYEISAPIYFLELNHAFWLIILSVSLAGVFSEGKAFHDKIVGSTVAPSDGQLEATSNSLKPWILGGLFGLFFWVLNVSGRANPLAENQYVIEGKFNVRVVEILSNTEALDLKLYILDEDTNVESIKNYIVEQGLVKNSIKKIFIGYRGLNDSEVTHKEFSLP